MASPNDITGGRSTSCIRASSAVPAGSPGNRPGQAAFCCLACGHTENAALNAAGNIAAGAAVNRPIAVRSPDAGGEVESQAYKEHGATHGSMPPTEVGGS